MTALAFVLGILLALGGGAAVWCARRRPQASPEREAAVETLRTETTAARAEEAATVREAEVSRDEQLDQARQDPVGFIARVLARVRARRRKGVVPLLLLALAGAGRPARADCAADLQLLAEEVVILEADVVVAKAEARARTRELAAARAVVVTPERPRELWPLVAGGSVLFVAGVLVGVVVAR